MFEHFPYTNFHDLNLDWVLSVIRDMDTAVKGIPALMLDTLEKNPQVVEGAVQHYTQTPEFEQLIKNLVNRDVLYINVTNPPAGYTAVVGDGVTDNTAAITALGAIVNATLFFPEGTYITQPVTVYGSVIGAGSRSILKRKTPYTSTGDYLINFASNKVYASSFAVDGAWTGQIASDKPAVLVHDNTFVSNLYIKNTPVALAVGDDCIMSVLDTDSQNGNAFVQFNGSGSLLVTAATHKALIAKGTDNYCIPDDLETQGIRPYIDVRSYGIKADNADNSSQMAALLASVPDGAWIVFPDGNFNFLTPITINHQVKISGVGTGSKLVCSADGIIINSTAPGTIISDIDLVANTTGYNGLTCSAANCLIDNVTFEDNSGATNPKYFSKSIYLRNPWNTEVRSCVINPQLYWTPRQGTGIECQSCANVIIRGCHIGIKNYGILLSRNQTPDSGHVCDGVQIIGCNLVVVTNGIVVETGANMIISNLIVDQIFGYGAVLGTQTDSVQGCYFNACYFGFMGSGSVPLDNPSDLSNRQIIVILNGNNISFNGCTLRCQAGVTPSRVLDTQVALFTSSRVVFVDCEFINANQYAILTNTSDANSDISISNCKFQGIPYPVYIGSAGQVQMSGCIGVDYNSVNFGIPNTPRPVNGINAVSVQATSGATLVNYNLGYKPSLILPVVTEAGSAVSAWISNVTDDSCTLNTNGSAKVVVIFIK